MKINLDKLRKMGWHVQASLSEHHDEIGSIELAPPPMHGNDYVKLKDVLSNNLAHDPMAVDLVLQATIIAMQKAALLVVVEE